MLTKLIADSKALSDALPGFQAAIDAVNNDLAGGGKVDTKQLATDAQALSETATAFEMDLEALQSDLTTLPQATADDGEPAKFKAALEAALELRAGMGDASTPEATRLQNLICAGIPIYNIFAGLYGLPVLPLPAFCS